MELTKKQLIELVQFATGKIHSSFTWESEAEDTVDEYLKAINYTHSCTELPSRDCVKKISNEKFNEWRKSAGIDYESHYLGFVSGVNWMFFDYLTK